MHAGQQNNIVSFTYIVPSRPTVNSTVVTISNTSITIGWFQPPGDRVDYFLVNYHRDRCGELGGSKNVTSTHGRYGAENLTGLQPFSAYSINITAVNGNGSNSTSITLTTHSSG